MEKQNAVWQLLQWPKNNRNTTCNDTQNVSVKWRSVNWKEQCKKTTKPTIARTRLTIRGRPIIVGIDLEQGGADVWSEYEETVPDLCRDVWITVEQHHGARHRHDERHDLHPHETQSSHLRLSRCDHRVSVGMLIRASRLTLYRA